LNFDNALIQIVFIPVIVGFILLFVPDKFKLISKALVLLIATGAFALAIKIFSTNVEAIEASIFSIEDFSLDLLLKTTPLNKFMLLFAMGFGLLITVYSLSFCSKSRNTNIFSGAVLLTIGGSAGILLCDHLLFMLIFWEVVTASLYLLISTGGKEAKFAATKSFAMIGASDAALLLGIAMVWIASGTFTISAIKLDTVGFLPVAGFLLLMVAAITKAGSMPLHTWIPASGTSAPVSVMALLPAAIDKLLGIYLLIVITRYMFNVSSAALQITLAVIGSATIIIAVMVAMVQHDLKKLLSYHAVSQVGYMILGIATGTAVGIAGAVFHMLNNAIYKCCLFLCGGAVEEKAGTSDLESLGGLGKKMPITFITCLIAAFIISGIPPLNGFVSKWMIYQGIIEMGTKGGGAVEGNAGLMGLWPIWFICAMFGSALTLASFVKLLYSLFLSRMPAALKEKSISEVCILKTLPMITLALLCVGFGVFYYVPLEAFIYPALDYGGNVIEDGQWESVLGTIGLMAGVVVGLAVVIVGLAGRKIRIVPTWYCGEKIDNDSMIIPGTHFYKTVSSMKALKPLYDGQAKGYFDPYNQAGGLGMLFSRFLSWMHNGVLPVYLTWMMLGLLIIIIAVCQIL